MEYPTEDLKEFQRTVLPRISPGDAPVIPLGALLLILVAVPPEIRLGVPPRTFLGFLPEVLLAEIPLVDPRSFVQWFLRKFLQVIV